MTLVFMIPLKCFISALNCWLFKYYLIVTPDYYTCIIELKFMRSEWFSRFLQGYHLVYFYVLPCHSLKVFLVKYSFGDLSEFADGYLGCLPFPLTLVVSKYIMLVALIVKQIIVLFSHLVRSFITEDQINPVMEIVTNIFAL